MVSSTKANPSGTPKKPASSNSARKPMKSAKPNGSILNFFQKAPKPEDSLFFTSTTASVPAPVVEEYCIDSPNDEPRFNENESSNKKRRTSPEHSIPIVGDKVDEHITESLPIVGATALANKSKHKIKTPFVMESDSEDEQPPSAKLQEEAVEPSSAASQAQLIDAPSDTDANPKYESPPLKKEESTSTQSNDWEDFADLEGFDSDDFEGEEMLEKRYMGELEDLDDDVVLNDQSPIEKCPICNGSLLGLSAQDVTQHVNQCLDGDANLLPTEDASEAKEIPVIEAAEISTRFARQAVPRPGQANPFEVTTSQHTTASAFSKLMSGNAEDSAWATAAAAESAARGRPAYQRTCPFYKIMPGFSICVDAFRYGAVEGCEAYFLSHFHSDHYIGLTANWRHGPIYCSRVTGSLVKQQLRTAAKWVVELEFEKPFDIPGTDGASVTMIPANHCPGSSLFLFEKPFRTGNGQKTKRILHCGDFRACPDHVRHPLLKPDILDSLTGKLRPQKIDLCYLDTTYLNPRYSFPPQGDVIRACADLCASMSPDPDPRNQPLLKMEKAAEGGSVDKYFQSGKSPERLDSQSRSLSTEETKQRLLVVCGTYSIGKERICVAIAKSLKSKIFASPAKIRICKQLGDAELSGLLTSDPVEAQVHMQMLMEIRAETLQGYLDGYKPHFSRVVGFRPSGWNFRQASGKTVSANMSPNALHTDRILHGTNWRTRFEMQDLVAQRGSTREAMCFGVPYSEHSSFRELAMFVMSLRIEKVVPTVNVGSEQSRKRMKGWIDKWMAERRKGGFLTPLAGGEDDAIKWGSGKPGAGGGAWW